MRSTSVPPALRVGSVTGTLDLDGRLDEPVWSSADSISDLTQLEPTEGISPTGRTVVRVLATTDALVIGVRADDPDPARIVSFARERDAVLTGEDHVKLVLDTYRDGRSGYVFAVNPNGARYDALVANQGEGENANWDAVWEAATARTLTGWSAEIRIPIQSLQFRPGLTEWGFNVQRRVQRLQETDRWASPSRDYEVTQTFRAGRLTGVPPFALGLGLAVRPALTAGAGVPSPRAPTRRDRDASLDVTQRLGANTLAAVTVNTDFAETEIDTRRTNLTRFPLVFPEKRTFFLQGADIFDFGLGTGDDVRPFFSRRVGLYNGVEVPIRVGGKVSGRSGGTNYGALVVRTGDIAGGTVASLDSTTRVSLPPTESTMGVVRIRQNLLRESSVGLIGTLGDPLGRAGSWTAGTDATYQTSHFRGDKNFLVGVWGIGTGREGLAGGRGAFGGKVDYPNDLLDAALVYKYLGDGFDPSIGFVPRPAVQIITLSATYQPRPTRPIAGLHVRQMFHEFEPQLVTDLAGSWESYEVFMAPVNWRLESGDRFEFNVVPAGERLAEAFEIAEGVTIPAGSYHWRRYRIEGGLAAKRRFSAQAAWWFGGFYTGRLDELQLTAAWKPSPLFIVELDGTRNIGRLREGRFTQDLVGTRLRFNVSPDLQLNSYVQYDNESDTFGTNTRLRWTFSPLGDLFVVYNHNLRHDIDPSTGRPVGGGLQTSRDRRWGFASNQLLVKLQYAFRY
ncbi:MAG TPA: DUF5916 domain-containing protein [Gemmatimonadaceae bacterium]|nr:DUF5916 domain-containing protein [Gemmatimonadaceae bacterium]